jgi:UDP-N-acetyl-D-glucosamine dehydrogenase
MPSFADWYRRNKGEAATRTLPVVCVQGLVFVGVAMAIAVASARDASGDPVMNVIGVELPTPAGRRKISLLNRGQLPLVTTDEELKRAFRQVHEQGNFFATSDETCYRLADIAVVDIPLDVDFDSLPEPKAKWDDFRAGIRTLGRYLPPGSLVLVETTVPPGTCERVVASELAAALKERGLKEDALLLAHSYERVMPGRDYYRSIVNFWRVYAATTAEAADAARDFLSKIINVAQFPLTRLDSTTASETAKILENSYRAATIAFIEEWGRFAEAAGIDLFQVIDAIRQRPTHSNMRQPGFGVGGYCLTKDPLLAQIGARDLLGLKDVAFDVSRQALEINQRMPLVSLDRLERAFGGRLKGRQIALLGVTYREDVADTRYSPSETFYRAAQARGANVIVSDPLTTEWPELGIAVSRELPNPASIDAMVLAVQHRDYQELDFVAYLGSARPVLLDANRVLKPPQIEALIGAGHDPLFIGRGKK